jgi:hypothetical protein
MVVSSLGRASFLELWIVQGSQSCRGWGGGVGGGGWQEQEKEAGTTG